jgi:UDP-N-acetylmuramate--alanine ligase
LAFSPLLSVITGISWDHHEIYPTREDYQSAFREFISQSGRTVMWQEDFDYLELDSPVNLVVQSSDSPIIQLIQLKGLYNRLDAWLAVQTVHRFSDAPIGKLVGLVNAFPGLTRRMEEIRPNLYSDYAHTPEKIRGALSVAMEIAETEKRAVVVIYEPLTNRRQHYIIKDYKDCFDGATKVYWLPSYLAREDPKQRVIEPAELIAKLADPKLARPAKIGPELKEVIDKHLSSGDMVVGICGGGGNSLDEWLRKSFKAPRK